jgi:ankyrin repeat protein
MNTNVIVSHFVICLAAVRSKNLDCVLSLLAHGVDVNRQSFDNSTALHAAVSADQSELVTHLLRNGANVDLLQDEEISAVFLASHLGYAKCLKALVDHLKTTG